jgi:uncharacterized repeat protein (TIGR02543 family)
MKIQRKQHLGHHFYSSLLLALLLPEIISPIFFMQPPTISVATTRLHMTSMQQAPGFQPTINPRQASGIQSVFATFQNNVSGTPTAPNLIVDNTLYVLGPTPIRLQWVNVTTHSVQFLPFFTAPDLSVRYNFSRGTISNSTRTSNMTSNSVTLTPQSNTTFTALYSTQYRLMFSGPQGNVSSYYNAGKKVTVSVPNFTSSATPSGTISYYYVSKPGQVRYRFLSVTGSVSSATPSNINITMAGPVTEVINSQVEYGLTVTGIPVSPPNTTWYNASQVAVFKPALISVSSNGTSYNVTGWKSTPAPSSTNSTAWTFVMNQPVLVAANFSLYYYLSVQTPYGKAKGSGWYLANSTATFSISQTISGSVPFDYVFTGWAGDFIGSSPTASIRMTHPVTIIANWAFDARGPVLITVIPVIAALAWVGRTYLLKRGKE